MVFGLSDDTVYVSLLIGSIVIGKFYKDVTDVEKQKWIGTITGLLLIFIVSGWHIFHIIISALICGLILMYGNKRQCHKISFIFMFGYLLFFRSCNYFGFSTPPGHTNLIQMILTLKSVGLAFEINTTYLKSKSNPEEITNYDKAILNITPIDIIQYWFNYIGVLTGPYYRYRTYYDYFALPFKNHANCWQATINKLTLIPVFAFVYLAVSHYWPLSYALTEEMYVNHSVLYRFMFIWPAFIIFRMRIYIGVVLSECACTMVGFGAYPKEAKSSSGGGPASNDYLALYKTNLNQLEYDFETIRNVDPHGTETSITFRETMKCWNMCIQYWLAVHVYKRFPSKKYRTLATLLVSAYWHGVYSGYYLCIVGVPFYLPIEDLYNKLYRIDATGIKRRIIDGIFWIGKWFAFSYLAIAFYLLHLNKIWHYYNSIYHIGYIYFAVLYAIGIVMLKRKPKKLKD